MASLAGSSRPVDAADAADLRKGKGDVETAQARAWTPWCHRRRAREKERKSEREGKKLGGQRKRVGLCDWNKHDTVIWCNNRSRADCVSVPVYYCRRVIDHSRIRKGQVIGEVFRYY